MPDLTALGDALVANPPIPQTPVAELRRRARRHRRRRRYALSATSLIGVVTAAGLVGWATGTDRDLSRVRTRTDHAASASRRSETTVSDTPELRTALAMWSSFPVTASPRPLVIPPGRAILDPASGFVDSRTKGAYLNGGFIPPPSLPSGPATVDGFPIVSAQDGLAALQANGDGQGADLALKITGMRLASATFDTDRGPRVLPAWLVSFATVADPAAVLAVAPRARYQPPALATVQPSFGIATISADGRHLSVAHAEDTTDPPDTVYTAEVAESDQAVAVSIVRHLPDGYTPGNSLLMTRNVQTNVDLQSSLGARVLIDGHNGAAVPVQSPPVPSGTNDEAAVRAAALGWLDTQPRDDVDQFVEDFGSIRNAIRAGMAQHSPTDLAGYTGQVGTVNVASPNDATFDYTLLLSGSAVYPNRHGTAVRIGGTWKVSRATVCELLGLGGIACPPHTGR